MSPPCRRQLVRTISFLTETETEMQEVVLFLNQFKSSYIDPGKDRLWELVTSRTIIFPLQFLDIFSLRNAALHLSMRKSDRLCDKNLQKNYSEKSTGTL